MTTWIGNGETAGLVLSGATASGTDIVKDDANPATVTFPHDWTTGLAADNSTAAVGLIGVTATHQLTTDEPPVTFNGTELSLAQFIAFTNTDLQTAKYQLTLTGEAGGILSFFSLDSQSPDVTPPIAPTGGKQGSGDRWGMWWDQSPEGPTTTSRLRRVVDGVPAYLANVAGLATWVASIPTTWWVFSRGLASADSQSNSWEEEDIIATTITYAPQHVDPSGNNSAWVNFTEAIADPDTVLKSANGNWDDDNTIPSNIKEGELFGLNEVGTFNPSIIPGAPTLVTVTPGNGEFTVDFTTVLATDIAKIQYAKTSESAWTIDTQTNEGSGSITIVVGEENNTIEYIVTVLVEESGCPSLTSNKAYVIPVDLASIDTEIVRYRVTRTTDGEGGYIDLPADPLVIYPTLRYDNEMTTMNILTEADIIPEDVISVYAENYYRVLSVMRNTSGLYKDLDLEKIERPTGFANNE